MEIDVTTKTKRVIDIRLLPLLLWALIVCGVCAASAQTPSDEIKTGVLLKRGTIDGEDNYAFAAFSFQCGGNGPEVQKLCRNDWDILFGNSPLPDAFDVTTVTDDRSRIKDLGKHNWEDSFHIPRLPAYEEPEREPSIKAVEGHMYLVHTRDSDTDLYALFRVEKLEPGKSVEITWKVIAPPAKTK
ncbi:MAG: hypothetical protein JNJ50_03595 [Acidobacteria bacterium]|nr:hypothetical protein [Acidobacteriota bacterium]